MADTEQWDRHALEKLMQRGSMTLREITESVASEQPELLIVQAWVESALERGSIETGWNESARCNITAAGRKAAGVRTGRFVVSEKARDGAPSRRS